MPAFLAFALLTVAYLLLGSPTSRPRRLDDLADQAGRLGPVADGLCAWYLELGLADQLRRRRPDPALPVPYASAATRRPRRTSRRCPWPDRLATPRRSAHDAGVVRGRRDTRDGRRGRSPCSAAARSRAGRGEPRAGRRRARAASPRPPPCGRRRPGRGRATRCCAGRRASRRGHAGAPLARSTTATKPSVSAVARARGARRGGAAVRRRAAPGRRARRHAGARGGSRPLIRGRHAQRSRRARAVVLHLPLVRDGPRCVTGACDHGA